MFKFLTQGAKIIKISSSIITIGTLAVLAAVITTLALSSFTAEAQGDPGAVANLQLTSTSAGELTVSWDAASPTPTDYRVDWAKSSEDYTSWKVEDGHVYTAETATTTTITDLSHDTEYKIRMRARYYRGEHEGKSWGGPWAEATITVAGEPAETPTPEPVKEEPVQQPPRDAPDPPAGTIDTLTATDETGQLLLTWTAPNSDPTDYHINWTKSTEEYPANTAEAGNAHPTGTTHTLAGLEFDTDYNIRVRARYSDGENAANPWNGPWTETTVQVKLPLPAAPFIGAIAVTPDVDVLLSWFNLKEDDSITGYQILRGPDADSLVVIEDGTGSSSTSYTDTAPPAGQTHTYGVKARNASGLSDLSNTLTATVPAAEEEEILITAQQKGIVKLGGNGTVNTGIVGVGYQEAAVGSAAQNRYFGYATSFTPGGDGWYHLSSIGFTIRKEDARLIRVAIHEDNSGGPADAALYVTYTELESETAVVSDLTATFPNNATLEAGKTYWAVLDEITGSGLFHLFLAEDNSEDAGFESWAIGDVGYEINYLAATGFTWNAASDDTTLLRNVEPILMTFQGYAEPERVLVGAHGLRNTADDGPLLRFGTERVTKAWLKLPMGQTFDFCEPTFVAGSGTERSWRLCDLHQDSHYDHEWAGGREFTTGPNPTGYTITALGVDMDAEEGTINPVATIHRTSAFQTTEGSLDPQSPLANYQAQADIAGSPNSFAPRTGSEEVHLAPNTTYVAYFENDATGYFETPNARAGQDPGAEDGWTLGYPYGGKFVHPLGFAGESWNFGEGDSRRIPLNIHGWPNPLVAAPNPEPPAPSQTLVSNLDKTPNTDDQIVFRQAPSDITLAYSFTTGSHGAGYSLHGVQIEVAFEVGFIVGLQATIHTDNSETPGRPGASLHELGLQTNPQLGLITFHAPADAVLEAHTTHWLVIETADGASITSGILRGIQLNATADAGLHACAARDWSLGSNILKKPPGISSWGRTSNRLKMAILGKRVSDPSVESSEPTCDDLPESTTTTGRLIVDGDGVKGQHQTQGDADWYSVDLEADTYYQFTANPGKKGLPYYTLRIFNDQGVEQRNSLIAKKDDAYHSPDRRNVLPFRTQTTGTYYVSIEAWRGNGSAVAYTLAMSGDDYSDDVYTKATFAVDASGRNFENFQNYLMRTSDDPEDSETSDVDWIHVFLKANTTYKIIYDVACLHEGIIAGIYDLVGNPIPNTEAFFKSHEKIRWCSDITTRFTPASDGDYYIAVTARGANFPHRNNSGLILNEHWNSFTGVQGTLSITVTSPPSAEDPTGERKLLGVSQRVTSTPTRGTDSDTYGVGDEITFELAFSEPVRVDGTPELRFAIGSVAPGHYFLIYAAYASFVSGVGTDTLTFSYTVLAADRDTNGIYLFDDPITLRTPNDSIVSIRPASTGPNTNRSLTAENFFSGWDRTFPGHKVDGSLTN